MWKLTFRSAQVLQGVFQGIQRVQERVSAELQEIAWEIALWVRKRNMCGACQDPEHPREFDLSLMSHTEANCSRRDFSLLASTYLVMLKAERIHQMLILKMKFDLLMASFALPFLLTQKRVNICYSQTPICYKYIFAWSSALPRLFDGKLKEQKWTQWC